MKKKLITILLVSIALLLSACSISFDLFGKTPTPAPTEPPVPTLAPTEEPVKPGYLQVTVYFMDENRFLAATEPYEVGVSRQVALNKNPAQSVLELYFEGPTAEEQAAGLKLLTSGFTGVKDFYVNEGIAHVYLDGKCANNGAAYSVAALIFKNLEQFQDITAVKIYDENGSTEDPDSTASSIPYCLEP
jgi:hypothetical protein